MRRGPKRKEQMDSAAQQIVILAAIAAVVTLATPVIAFLLARVVTQQSTIVKATEQIHTIVNSADSEAKKRLAEMNERLLEMTALNAALRETAKNIAQAKEVAEARAELPPLATHVTVPVPVEIVATATTVPVEIVKEKDK